MRLLNLGLNNECSCRKLSYLHVLFTLGRAEEDDFRLFVADAAGYINMLDSDLNLHWQYFINSQVIGVTVDPDSTHADHTIVYSTMSSDVYSTMSSDIRELFIETEKNVRLFDFCKYQ